ncbi:hypothetical protein SAMN04488107_1866 [Geodermatophilus saharensis]|uniref:Uncharacterized protein n=1 Tax=Geodermatophilus saharensis TaxID=1137994 RepID=A0A239CXM2_9ACTN|nr:hypothetical protein [Geodermatophilus saharensis]SNS24508.1 hypothetical protein SAMN04488107_1866 [Geodermatophilus saharensis]
MENVPSTPAPGDLTVPLLSGWEGVGAGLLLLAALAVMVLLLAAARPGAGNRSEWQAWLDARSGRAGAAPADPADGPGAIAEG